MDSGSIISIISIVVSIIVTIISGLIGLVLKLNARDRQSIKDSIDGEHGVKTDIKEMKSSMKNTEIKLENKISDEASTLHDRCNHLDEQAKKDRERSHESEIKILSELADIKALVKAL